MSLPKFAIGIQNSSLPVIRLSSENPNLFKSICIAAPTFQDHKKDFEFRKLLCSLNSKMPFRIPKELDALKSIKDELIPFNSFERYGTFASLQEEIESIKDLLPNLKTPILHIHGGNDEFTNIKIAWEGFNSIGTDIKNFLVFNDLNHELMVSNDYHKTIIKEINGWFNTRL